MLSECILNEHGLLTVGKQKHVGYISIHTEADIREAALQALVKEAVLLNEPIAGRNWLGYR